MIPLPEPAAPPSRLRPALLVVIATLVAVALAGLAGWATLSAARAVDALFVPGAEDGHLEGAVSLDDDRLPAIARLNPALRDAMRTAEAAASLDGISFDITSGWRSPAYQEWLFDDAVRTHGSAEVARQFVATPERSHHVTGAAVDVGNLDGQLWLQQHGVAWGLCQIYANERWHFELATTPGGVCPAQLPDAAG